MKDPVPARRLSRALLQLGWLVLFWLLGVLSLGVLAAAVRLVLPR